MGMKGTSMGLEGTWNGGNMDGEWREPVWDEGHMDGDGGNMDGV